ncbi:MAG: aldose epimerase [Streptosporangiales bacterium]|nr:aldose epimerase [Streptosporangiales bacterium]
MTTISGAEFTIAAAGYRAVVTLRGAGLRELTYEGRDLILTHPAGQRPPGAAGQVLAPWPNRIDKGRYFFGDTEYHLEINEPERNTAIHGLVRWVDWDVVEEGESAVALAYRLAGAPGYPFQLDLEMRYALGDDGLTASLTAGNPGDRDDPAAGAVPYGNGAHPYLTLGRPIDDCTLTVPAAEWLPTDDRGIPHGMPHEVRGEHDLRVPRRLGPTRIDNAFTGLTRDDDDRAWVRLAYGSAEVGLWLDTAYPWVEIFTGDTLGPGVARLGVACEPMTCPPNAFAAGRDVIVLEPGEVVTTNWGIARLS